MPPLPPERTNSNATTGPDGFPTLDGHDKPHRLPPTPPSTFPTSGYTHHLIRDFMFLDAAAANKASAGPPPAVTPLVTQQVTVRFTPLAPATFANVVIYFHPTPGQAGYDDGDYQAKSNGGNPNRSNWKELLGYVDRLGSQLAGAVKLAAATPNQIVIVPLMRN